MEAIIYRAPDGDVEGYAVRLDNRASYEPALDAVRDHYHSSGVMTQHEAARVDEISDFLEKLDKTVVDPERHFDLTFEEAGIAINALKECRESRMRAFASRMRRCTFIETIVRAGLLSNPQTASEYKGFFSEVPSRPRATSENSTV